MLRQQRACSFIPEDTGEQNDQRHGAIASESTCLPREKISHRCRRGDGLIQLGQNPNRRYERYLSKREGIAISLHMRRVGLLMHLKEMLVQ